MTFSTRASFALATDDALETERTLLLGMSNRGRLLLVVHVEIDEATIELKAKAQGMSLHSALRAAILDDVYDLGRVHHHDPGPEMAVDVDLDRSRQLLLWRALRPREELVGFRDGVASARPSPGAA